MLKLYRTATVPEGHGVTVKRLMPLAGLRNFDPFVLWDHFDIRQGGFPEHPHCGFEAITYLFDGGMRHTDNLGNKGTIHAGGAQRFTAGSGIVHSEMPDGHAAGIQLWINLPGHLKDIDPDYQQAEAGDIPEHRDNDVITKTIVGDAGPVVLHTPVEYLDIVMHAGTTWMRDVPAGFRGLVYLVEGDAEIDGMAFRAGEAACAEDEESLTISTDSGCRVMWCFGRPHGEPIHQHGPFVD
ncbi:MAG: pirin family protein [Mariprofundaceae bacterium]|nr:pirin family protein [Mariprofundaceae bacterium]